MMPPCPVALFVPEDSVYGLTYLPANKVALALCRLAGSRGLRAGQLDDVRELGFRVAEPNGVPIPFPKPDRAKEARA